MPDPAKTELKPEHYTSLMTPGADLGAAYTAVAGLQFSVNQMPPEKLRSTIRALAHVLAVQPHQRQRQSYFLHRKAADALQDILTGTFRPDIAGEARHVLVHCLSKSGTTALRAAAEALGRLPVSLPTSKPPLNDRQLPLPEISWPDLLGHIDEDPTGKVFQKGRNLILPLTGTGRILTIKTAMETDARNLLWAEGLWMDYLTLRWLCIRD